MKKYITQLIIQYIITLCGMFGMFFIVSGIYNIINKTTVEKQVFISDRKDACEKKGGKYGFYWSDFDENYTERCDVTEKEIKDF